MFPKINLNKIMATVGVLFMGVTLISPLSNINLNAQKVGITPFNEQGQSRRVFNYVVDAGATINDSVVITNGDEVDGKAVVRANDVKLNSGGNVTFKENDETNDAVGNWIKLAEGDVTIPASKALKIPFTINVPAGTPAGEYAGGITVAPGNDVEEAASGVSIKTRSGITVYILVKGDLKIDNEVKDFSAINPKSDTFEKDLAFQGYTDLDNMVAKFYTKNLGNMYSDIKGTLEVTSTDGSSKSFPIAKVLNLGSEGDFVYQQTKLPYKVGTTKFKLTYESIAHSNYDVDFSISDRSKGVIEYEMTLTEADLQKFQEIKNKLKDQKVNNKNIATQANKTEDFSVKALEEGEETATAATDNTLLYALGGGLAVVTLALIGVVIYFVMKNKKNKKEDKTDKVEVKAGKTSKK